MKVFQHLLRRLKYFREPVSTGMSVKVWVAGKKTMRSFNVYPFLNLRGLIVPRGLVLNENLNKNLENKGCQ